MPPSGLCELPTATLGFRSGGKGAAEDCRLVCEDRRLLAQVEELVSPRSTVSVLEPPMDEVPAEC